MKSKIFISIMMLLAGGSLAIAQDTMTADQIMTKVDTRIVPKDVTAQMRMDLIDNKGSVRQRTVKTNKLGDDKQIMWFLSPADVKGSSFLRMSYDDKDDDMWIYLPAFGKVRRIASSAKNGSFMGTDFTFEDLGERKLKDYSYKLLQEEKVGERACWVIESTPKTGVDTDYAKIVSWIWKDDYVALKEEFYGKKGALTKIKTTELVQIAKYWVPKTIQMNDIKNRHKTVMDFTGITVDTGVKEEIFSTSYLTRIN